MKFRETPTGGVLESPRSVGWTVAALIAIAIGGLSLLTTILTAFGHPRTIQLRCDRAQASCVLDNQVTARSFRLDDIKAFKVNRSYNRSFGASRGLELDLTSGAKEMFCDASESIEATRGYGALANQVNAFLRGETTSASISCPDGAATWTEIVQVFFFSVLLLAVGITIAMLGSSQSTELRADGAGAFIMTEKRWFRRPSRVERPLSDLRSIELTRFGVRCALADGGSLMLSPRPQSNADRRALEAFHARLDALVRSRG